MPTGPASNPWRKYLRFSLRGLIVLVLVIGAGLGWVVRRARIQSEAAAAIVRDGGWVLYDWQENYGSRTVAGKPSTLVWLADRLGLNWSGQVRAVGLFVSSTPTDSSLAHVGRLTGLRTLSLARSNVTDAGLAHLEGLTDLPVLYLGKTRVTDAGLAHLKRLYQLRELDLAGTQITDAGLAHLNGLAKLNSLNLSGTKVTDAGLAQLKCLPKLSFLNISDTRATPAGIYELKQARPGLAIYQ
jgi:hypothetical protein